MVVDVSPKFEIGEIVQAYHRDSISSNYKRCPICEGRMSGIIPLEAEESGKKVTCTVCEGRGVVPSKVVSVRIVDYTQYKIIGIKINCADFMHEADSKEYDGNVGIEYICENVMKTDSTEEENVFTFIENDLMRVGSDEIRE